jgi:putative PIN family toxin of toxin-antitoxin system
VKIVIDTNLWISFLIGKKSSMLKTLLSDTELTVYVCDELIDEIKSASSKTKIQRYISVADINAILELIDVYCKHVVLYKKATSPIRDAKDLFLLSLAETVHANFILTGDKDLLILRSHLQTKIVTYSMFISKRRLGIYQN